MSWLHGNDLPQMGAIRKQLADHVAKCLNEAIEQAEKQWRKMKRG